MTSPTTDRYPGADIFLSDFLSKIESSAITIGDPFSPLRADMQTVGEQLLSTATRLYGRHFDHEFRLIFKGHKSGCTDGKTIYIHALDFLSFDNNSEGTRQEKLASVIAHELGHCIRSHVEESRKSALEARTIESVDVSAQMLAQNTLVQSNPILATTLSLLSNVMKPLQTLQESKTRSQNHAHEYEADAIGTYLLLSSGYSNSTINLALEYFKSLIGENAAEKSCFTHPSLSRRIRRNLEVYDALSAIAKTAIIVFAVSQHLHLKQV